MRIFKDFISILGDAFGKFGYILFTTGGTQADIVNLIDKLKTKENLRDMILCKGGWRIFPPACVVVGVLELENFLDDIISVWAVSQNNQCTEAAIFAILKTGGNETLSYLADMLDKSSSHSGHYKSENDACLRNAIDYVSNTEMRLSNTYWYRFSDISSDIGKLN